MSPRPLPVLLLLCGAPLLVAASPPPPCVALTTPAYDAEAKFRAVHIDTLDPKFQRLFEEARVEWLKALVLHHTTDGRGFFLQRAGGTFITLRSFNSFAEYDALRTFRATVAERIGADGERAGQQYDRGDVALRAPHNSEVWSRLDSLDYHAPGAHLNEYTAGYMRMVVEQVSSEEYEETWREIHAALTAAQFPLSRITFFSSLGSGKHISLWLATSRAAFESAGSPEQAVARTLGAAKAAALFTKLRSSCSDVRVDDVVPRPEFASPE